MMKRTWILIAASALALTFAACGPKEPHMLSCEEYYQQGLEALESEDWVDAQKAFERITLNYPGCERVDDAQYMLGQVYFRQGLFIEAQFEFRRLVEDFRLSDRLEDGQYMLDHTNCHGTQLGSSIERMAVERPLEERAAAFKAITFPQGTAQW